MSPSAVTCHTVMNFAGLDPTGGAGLPADTEAIVSVGCHPLPVITALSQAKKCTFDPFKYARRLRERQLLPDRLYWARALRSPA